MTRTKNKFYVTVPNTKKSIFIKEVSKYNNVISNNEIIKYNVPIKVNYRCPKCGEIVTYRYTNSNCERIYKCFNKDCNYSRVK